MVKMIFLVLLIFVLFTVENKNIERGKTPTQYTRALEILHIVCGIFITLFATIHGIGHMPKAETLSIITGLIVLILLYSEIIIGILLKKKSDVSKATKTFHKAIPLAIICMIIVHIILRGIV
ncbi:hypothetical protein [Streptococcus pasteurianus]|uniref:hypothetical protein n=1 Tax=Streptococcus pasteurianus TaxID=197614 RepID=UPI003013A2EC